jgi:Ca2+/H+ antiporter
VSEDLYAHQERDGRRETDEELSERLNREVSELLEGLRVTLPGVQVLFAFLLTVPFTQAWGRTTDFQRTTYFITLMLVLAASAFLIAPSANHRLLFRQHDDEWLLRTSDRNTRIGQTLLALALTSASLLIADLLYARTAAYLTAAVCFTLVAVLWFAAPLARRRRLTRT